MTDRIEKKVDALASVMERGFKTSDAKIDALANAVGQGFKEVHERFDRLEGRVSVVEQKVDLVRSDIQELRYDYKKMLTRIEKLELQTFGSVQE